jgi:hypothetical protein
MNVSLLNRHSSDLQPLDNPTVQQMLLDDLVHIFLVYIGIPDPFGINDHDRPFFTAVETPGGIDADTPGTGYAQLLAAPFGVITHREGIEALATGAAVFTKIGTEKHVVVIVGHASTIPENSDGVKRPPAGKRPPCHAILFS